MFVVSGGSIQDVTKECTFGWYVQPSSCYAYLQVSSASGDFTDGETVTGQNSGATATVFSSYVDGGRVYVENVSGTFQAGETITGSSSNRTATVDGFVPERSWTSTPNNITHGSFPDSIISKDLDDYFEWESTLAGAGYIAKMKVIHAKPGLYFILPIIGSGEEIDSNLCGKSIYFSNNPAKYILGTTGTVIMESSSTLFDGFFYAYSGSNPLINVVQDDVGLSITRLSFYQKSKAATKWRIHNIRVLKLAI